MEERFIALETKAAYQEVTITELSDMVYRQQQTLEKMELTIKALKDKLAVLSEEMKGKKAADQKPPHY